MLTNDTETPFWANTSIGRSEYAAERIRVRSEVFINNCIVKYLN
jgi:hypothetical protein